MIRVFLSHDSEALRVFYGERALRELREFADVRINKTGQVLTSEMLLDGCRGCDVAVLDRNTPADATFFANADTIVAVHRGAVDIRTIDATAASRAGILVTSASPGLRTRWWSSRWA